MESVRGFTENQAMVDLGDAALDRRRDGWYCLPPPRRFLFPRHTRLFLAYGLQFGHARHCGRWFLYVRTERGAASLLYRHPQYVLPRRDDNWPRFARHARRLDRDSDRTYPPRLEPRLLCLGGNIHWLGALASLHFAKACQRPPKDGCLVAKHRDCLRKDLRQLFPEERYCAGTLIHADIPLGRVATGQTRLALPARRERGGWFGIINHASRLHIRDCRRGSPACRGNIGGYRDFKRRTTTLDMVDGPGNLPSQRRLPLFGLCNAG